MIHRVFDFRSAEAPLLFRRTDGWLGSCSLRRIDA
jgi:hypothetical protein